MGTLVIFWVSEVFWYFLGFGGILVIFLGFGGILVIFWVLVVFSSIFKFQGYFSHFLGIYILCCLFKFEMGLVGISGFIHLNPSN